MQAELIKALDSRPSDSSRSAGRERDGEFPGVFESTLARSGRSEATSESAREGSSSEGTEESSQGPVRGGRDAEDAPTPRTAEGTDAEGTDETRAEAVAESGAWVADAAVAAERPRAEDGDAALREELSRALRDETAGSRVEEDIAQNAADVLDDERAQEIVEQLKAAGQAGVDGEDASAAADAASVGAAASGVAQAAAASAEANAASDEAVAIDERDAAGLERALPSLSGADAEGAGADAGREQAAEANARESEAALFDRAAEGSVSSEVDPNLRRAIENAEAGQQAPDVTPVEGAAMVASPVAGQVTETTTTATPGSPQPVAASEAISVQTEWLATRGGGTARMVLHPPELGEIAIRVSLRGGAVEVVMVAQEAVAQGVAEEQSERLARAFANRDLRLEHFEVRRGGAEEFTDAGTGRFSESGAERDGTSHDKETGGGPGTPGNGPVAAARPEALPRILTRAPEAGVDLRI